MRRVLLLQNRVLIVIPPRLWHGLRPLQAVNILPPLHLSVEAFQLAHDKILEFLIVDDQLVILGPKFPDLALNILHDYTCWVALLIDLSAFLLKELGRVIGEPLEGVQFPQLVLLIALKPTLQSHALLTSQVLFRLH